MSQTGVMLLSNYSDDQEQEADWHAGRSSCHAMALFIFQSRQRTPDEIVAHYGVSLQFCAWRVPMTGVDVQVRRSRVR